VTEQYTLNLPSTIAFYKNCLLFTGFYRKLSHFVLHCCRSQIKVHAQGKLLQQYKEKRQLPYIPAKARPLEAGGTGPSPTSFATTGDVTVLISQLHTAAINLCALLYNILQRRHEVYGLKGQNKLLSTVTRLLFKD
jgi:hypothetical protein